MLDTLSPVLEAIKSLTVEQKATLLAHLQRLETCDDLIHLNAAEIRQFDNTISACPRCLSRHIIKWGSYKNRKRFKCNNCDRTFNQLTGTVWHGLHYHDKFKQYIKYMVEGQSLRACSSQLNICLQTAFYWRHKILISFENIDNQWLKKEIQADETFILDSAKGQKDIVTQLDRKARKRGGKADSAGITTQHICIMVAVDTLGNTLLKVAGKGRLTKKMVANTLARKIRKQRKNRAILVTDRHTSYQSLVKQKNLIHQTLIAKYKQYVNENGFNINKVNAIHSRFKRWLTKFCGVASKYLQNYLNYFRIWDKVNSFKERFNLFLQFSVEDNNVFIRNCDIGVPTN